MSSILSIKLLSNPAQVGYEQASLPWMLKLVSTEAAPMGKRSRGSNPQGWFLERRCKAETDVASAFIDRSVPDAPIPWNIPRNSATRHLTICLALTIYVDSDLC
jgi:hypothetical protein